MSGSLPSAKKFSAWVRPGVRLEKASRRRWQIALIADDFPALERPMKATSAGPPRGSCCCCATVVWNRTVVRRAIWSGAVVAAAGLL